MKESILGRFTDFSILRMVVFTGLFMIIGLSASYSQNFVTEQEAVERLRQELNDVNSNTSPFTNNSFMALQASNPAMFAYLDLVEHLYKHFSTKIQNGTANGSVRNSVEYARDRGLAADLVSDIYYENAFNQVVELLTD